MSTKQRLLVNGAALFAHKGFHGVGVEELGESVGLTGPSIYRHFRTKGALLAEMLISASTSLLNGAKQEINAHVNPEQTLSGLISRHVEFALSNPDLIRVHERDFNNLDEADARKVRRIQRRYVELWVEEIQKVRINETADNARTMAHAVFGLLNSTPRLHTGQKHEDVASLMHDLALRALEP